MSHPGANYAAGTRVESPTIEPCCQRCINERFCNEEPHVGCDFAPKTALARRQS